MLEWGDGLRTWRLTALPRQLGGETGGPIPAEVLPDHRREYLDYEGPVSRGRGTVTRVDRGEYVLVSEAADRLELELSDGRLTGSVCLESLPGDKTRWRLVVP